MLINFNIEKLDKLLYDFYTITDITISACTADFHQISYQPLPLYIIFLLFSIAYPIFA